ncbi:hypothetical protein ACFQWB_12920 [Paenibacillus thermoaerophilus]|uniref:PhiEco32-like amidoligase-type 2 protein n=1 Tax=Paenibacillus thermoaerophilus TaxID=1215385 RepID=A0ABW2V947_9BACL|nr:hypothetical protein [Paenibacillus thermoaerophilus]TMV17110.1 hypothetical protein FE781_08000 [Paenibacillus thermoaerophilus]
MATYVWLRDRRASALAKGSLGVPVIAEPQAGAFRFPGAGADAGTTADAIVVPWSTSAGYSRRTCDPIGIGSDVWVLRDGPIPEDWAECLSMHGIPAADEAREPPDVREWAYGWIVPVFHLASLGVWQTTSLPEDRSCPEPLLGGMSRLKPSLGQGLAAKAERMAIRAVYALGLDIGTMLVGMREGVMRVLKAWPGVPGTTEIGLEFAQAVQQFDRAWREERARGEPAALGADPEFVVRAGDGRVVPGERFAGKRGEFGCDAVSLPGGRIIYPLLELRPEPSTEPLRVVAHLRRTMLLARERIGDESLEWLAGGMPVKGLPLGGHVHFGGMWLQSRFLRTLDRFLAVPLLLVEDERSRMRRPRFGALGDFRRQPHGFEYRTLSSWLPSPRVTKAVFALARLLADGYLALPPDPDGRDGDRSWHEAFYRGDKERLRPFSLQGWERLRALPGYAPLAEWIEPLREMVAAGQSWDDQRDFRRAWRIPPFHMV